MTKNNINDPDLKKKYKWLQLDYKIQFLEVAINIGFVILYFKVIRDIFVKITNPEGKKGFAGIYKFFLKIFLSLKFVEPKFKGCKDLSKTECDINVTKICTFEKNKCHTNYIALNEFNTIVQNNITILNAFLTILFQTNMKNKINYLIMTYLNNENNILSVPNI